MILKRLIPIIILCGLSGVVANCGDTGFRSGGKSEDNATPAPTPTPQCKEKSEVVGVNVAFVVDNSGSNAETDCPNAQQVGYGQGGGPVYECGANTSRETAVLQSFDVLAGLGNEKESSQSKVAVVSFPGKNNPYSGADLQTPQWLDVAKDDRAALAGALNFTRRPMGMTPFREGLQQAHSQLTLLPKDQKKNLIILVTDGEPTDENAAALKSEVTEMLQASGAEIVSVLVTQGKARDQRLAEHRVYLENNGYSPEDIAELLGENGRKSLVESISSEVIEVIKAKDLEKVFSDLLQKRIKCD